MTTISIVADEIHLIEDGDFRTDPISVEATIIYSSENRWQISRVEVYAWGVAEDGKSTMRLIKPSPEIDGAIRHRIMTHKGWCEFISETIASEIRQAHRDERQFEYVPRVMA